MDSKVQAGLPTGWIGGLLDPDAYPHAVGKIQLIETHISWVFLTGKYAYKIKKPVDLGFCDFSTLARRKYFCEEELRLNQRTSKDFYLGVVPIGLQNGNPKIGLEPALEYAVRMRQFPAGARLDRRLAANRIEAGDMRRLATRLASFHRQLPAISDIDPKHASERASAAALNNFQHIHGDHISTVSRRQVDKIESWTRQQAVLLEPEFKRRIASGFTRECHGDLHLANLFEWDREIYPYDSLEFNPDLRWIDQISDIAFLVMDLTARDRTDLAYIFLNTWLEETGDYGGLAVLRFYLVYRSMVRLKVAAIQTRLLHENAQGEHAIKARHYLELARTLMEQPLHPWMVLMHGLSASGKTRTSAELIPAMPAIRIRSDLERKRLHGLPRHHHAGAGIDEGMYTPASTAKTYNKLAAYCETGLRAGFNMIADATFSKREWRRRFVELAIKLEARPAIMRCTAPIETLRARIRQRMAEGLDESDADLAVLEQQLIHSEPLETAENAIVVNDPHSLLNEL
jgi:aminoglycoside phosphotransferase family enzyme/predicted kinase